MSKTFDQCLGQGQLQGVMQQAKRLDLLDRALADILEPELKAHCRVASLRDGVLTLVVDGASWLTWLRFGVEGWLQDEGGRGALRGVKDVSWVLAPRAFVPPKASVRQPSARRLPKDAQMALRELADGLGCEPLKQALRRLSDVKRDGEP